MIAADGLHSAVAREVDAVRKTSRNPRWGVRAHFATGPWTDMVEIHYSPSGEAYVAPVSQTSVGVAILSSQPGRFEDQIEAYPELKAKLGERLGQEKGAGPFPQWLEKRTHGRILFVGDAAGFLDPLTGEGVQLGFNAARLAIGAIAADEPELYDRAWWRMTRSYWWLTSLILAVRRQPVLDRLFVPVLDMIPGLFDGALHLLGGTRFSGGEAEDEPRGPVVGEIIPDPVQHDAGSIPETDQFQKVEKQPGQPRDVAS
jgi:flavin-dependent dehydrogenase